MTSPLCPTDLWEKKKVLLAHGNGGRLTQELLDKIIRPQFQNEFLNDDHDGALLSLGGERWAFTTDSFVINPLFFPGGNIGELAIYGTANDLAMCGAKPAFFSCGFILEEGFELAMLSTIVSSIKSAAQKVGAAIVTGDTKVVDKGKGDGLFINTSGIGQIAIDSKPKNIQIGDEIILSGDIGRHGMAIMATRHGLRSELASDCAHLFPIVAEIAQQKLSTHCFRDLTRGGLATNLRELAMSCSLRMEIHEESIPVHDWVRAGCEILGLDPLYLACEGRMVIIAPPAETGAILKILKQINPDQTSTVIGGVTTGPANLILRNRFGSSRILDSLTFEQLPRIC